MKKSQLIVAFILLLVLASCGEGSSQQNEASSTADSTTSESVSNTIESEAIEIEPTLEATSIPEPTQTPEPPTQTPIPTDTPEPTATRPPTETPTPTPLPTPTLAPIGRSRFSPHPISGEGLFDNWAVSINELIRGEDALARIQAENSFNDPPQEGMEYVLINVSVTSQHDDGQLNDIAPYQFGLTGSKGIRYEPASLVSPEPEMRFDLVNGGNGAGWLAFSVAQDEPNLILLNRDETTFIAAEENAAIESPTEPPTISNPGLSRQEPVPFGELHVSDKWAIQINEVITGQEATDLLKDANSFNDPPPLGMQDILINISATYIGTDIEAQEVSNSDFDVTGDQRTISRELFYGVPPEPSLSAYLFTGGGSTGWIHQTSAVEEGNLILRYASWFEEPVFFSLQDGAFIDVASDISIEVEPNDLGSRFDQAAAFGETVITNNWKITVLETVRGEEAMSRLQDANSFNDPPEEGFEYILAKVSVSSLISEDGYNAVSTSDFGLLSSNGAIYDLPFAVEPYPVMDVWLYSQGTYEGWVALQAEIDETNVKLYFEPAERYLSLE